MAFGTFHKTADGGDEKRQEATQIHASSLFGGYIPFLFFFSLDEWSREKKSQSPAIL